MSKNAVVFDRTAPEAPLFAYPAIGREVHRSGEYLELIRRHFRTRSAVAIVAVGAEQSTGKICEDIATELAVSGKRVVIVSVDPLLRMNPVASPEESGCTRGNTLNVWLWPTLAGGKVEFLKSHGPADRAANWLDSLRQTFDSVLLDCPAMETAPAAAQLAAMADAAILVVGAGSTTRQQIQRDQRSLQLRGVKLTGCILMRPR
jgi:hypothetical protein